LDFFKSHIIDGLGRILLPSDARKGLGWETGDTVSMLQLDANTLVLQLSEKGSVPKCVICKTNEKALLRVRDAEVCEGCLEAAREISF